MNVGDRNSDGTFQQGWEVGNAGQTEQRLAGVNPWDTREGAQQKVLDARNRQMQPAAGAQDTLGDAMVVHGMRWMILGPITLVIVLGILGIASGGVVSLLKGSDPPGLARSLAAELSPPRRLSAPSVYLSQREIAAAAKGDALFSAVAGNAARTPAVQAAAYVCASDPACATQAWRRTGRATLFAANGFLLEQMKRGKATAAMDLCLLPLWAERQQPVRHAMLACKGRAKDAASGSNDFTTIVERLESPFFGVRAKLAEGYFFADCLRDYSDFCSLFALD